IVALGVAAGLAIYVLTTRAVKVATASTRTQFVASTDEIAGWLRDHGDRRGRVFSEFLGSNGVAIVSVNYARHMIPILSGFDEVAGWIYENNLASQSLMRTGPFWFDAVPMIDEAERFDVKYVVAGSPQLVHVLARDPRWREVHATPDLVLYERVGFEPSLASGDGLIATVVNAAYERGGGYVYYVDVVQDAAGPRTLVVKTNDSPAWDVRVDGVSVAHHPNEEGLVLVDLPSGPPGTRHVRLHWTIDEWRRRGRIATIAAVIACVLLVLLGRLKRRVSLPAIWMERVGRFALIVAAIVQLVRARSFDESIGGYGVAGGMTAVRDLSTADVGAYYDAQAEQPNHVLEGAWSARSVSTGVAMRTLYGDAPMAALTLGSRNRVVVRTAAPADDREHVLTLSYEDRNETACAVAMRFDTPVDLPPACVAGEAAGLGHHRIARVSDAAGVAIRSIEVQSDIRYVEAEAFHNTVFDGGCEAFYTMGASIDYFPTNGVMITAAPAYHCPIDMLADVDLEPRWYVVWVLAHAFHPRFRMTRGDLEVVVGTASAGVFDGVSTGVFNFWDSEGAFEWVRVGEVAASGGRTPIVLHLRRKLNAIASSIDFDAFAFVPK
ncbi:MAG TPA: hypothetical protein VH054_10965, partial [Polyangiaceae bacterium]|nr:hypothetical protein [Polyangiaceae bacterium]